MRTSRNGLLLVLLLPLSLAGCGTSSSTLPPTPAPDLTGNWQIQSGTLSVSQPQPGVLLLGALASQGSNVTGTFRFANLASTTACGFPVLTVISVTGTIDKDQNLTLTSQPFLNGSILTAHLLIASVRETSATGTIAVSGTTCSFPSGPALGTRFPSLTGSFAGMLTPGTASSPGTSGGGPATLVLTQATAPEADGQFPVTGTLTFTVGTCVSNISLSGLASGVATRLSDTDTPPTLFMDAFELPDGTAIQDADLTFIPAPCSKTPLSTAEFTGKLVRQ